MKRLIAVLSSLLILPAFAEVAPAYYYEEMMEYSDEYETPQAEEQTNEAAEETEQKVNTPVVPAVVSPRNSNTRSAASRAVATSTTTGRSVSTRTSNTTPARSVTARTATTTVAPTTGTTRTTTSATTRPTTTSRTATASRSTAAAIRSATTPGVTTRASSQTNNVNTARASIVQTDTASTPLYISNRAGVSTTAASVRARIPTARAGTSSITTTSTESTSSTISMDELAQVTDFCKAQYTACMDNFCNVLDDNQGRCSCSSNLDNYAETEAALKQATEELQDVAQKIQYIGLSAEQVETLFTQTEAELEMQTTTDNTKLKNDLDKIKDLIVDVQSGKASSSSSGLSFDLSGLLDFSIDGTGFDLSSLLGTGSNTNSISNQRGEQLYKTAAARCKASVLNSCQAQGVDISIITNAYDLEIDKQCIIYERTLTESNDQMASTVRNAKNVLQRARLLVAQQKNAYNLRECITELDNCMQEDIVCGDDYENCLDPTGKYIVNGEIVVGSTPGSPSNPEASIYSAIWKEGDNNPWADENYTLSKFIEDTVTSTPVTTASTNISEYLQNKIGWHDDSDGKNYGMCISILNQCQDITYTGTGQNLKYNPANNVIKEFLNRTLVQIKAAQDEILSDYAEDCVTDVKSCLVQNNYDASKPLSTSVAINACDSIIKTCMSVTGETDIEEGKTNWIQSIVQGYNCPEGATGTYPNCDCGWISGTNTLGYDLSSNECKSCPGDALKTSPYPYCTCPSGKTYDQATNTCKTSGT